MLMAIFLSTGMLNCSVLQNNGYKDVSHIIECELIPHKTCLVTFGSNLISALWVEYGVLYWSVVEIEDCVKLLSFVDI